MFFVFAYDIPDNRRRYHVARLLDGVAERVQYSVFEGIMDDTVLENTIRRLEKIIHPGEDTVRIYRICATCKGQIVVMGRGQVTEIPDVIVI